MKRKIVLIAAARTGGTLLQSTLDELPLFSFFGEPFNIQKRPSARIQKVWLKNFFYHDFQQNEYTLIGFRTKIEQIADLDSFCEQIHTYADGVIFLERKNIIKKAVSRIRAERLYATYGDYNLKKGNTAERPKDEPIPLRLLKHHIRICEEEKAKTQELAARIQLPTLLLTYEELNENKNQFFQRVFSFFGMEPLPLNFLVEKYTSDDLQTSLPNFKQLLKAFEGHPFENMFLEGSKFKAGKFEFLKKNKIYRFFRWCYSKRPRQALSMRSF